MLHQFDHRWATYEGLETRDVTIAEKIDPTCLVLPRYWVREEEVNAQLKGKWNSDWVLGWRRISNTTNERTFIVNVLPKTATGDSVFHLSHQVSENTPGILCNLISFAFDFVVRQKMGGTNLNFYIVNQFSILPPQTYQQPCSWRVSYTTHHTFLLPRVLELTYTAYDLHPFAQDCGYFGPSFRWSEERRFLLRCELDAAYFHLYGIARDDVAYIMDTFPIVRRKDEDAFGEYRTKRVILEIYDEMAEAIHTGQSYQTRLDPPPADPRTAHAWDETYLGPYRDPSTWWQEVERAKDEKVMEQGEVVMYQPQSATSVSHSVKEPAPTFQLRSPALPSTKKEEITDPPTTHATQQPLLDVVPAPTGPRSRRLKQAMALGKDSSLAATRELVAFLADEDGNIRWLAGSSLVQRANSDVVAAIISFLGGAEAERVATARPEIQRVLGLIAETAENEAVRDAAKNRLAQLDG